MGRRGDGSGECANVEGFRSRSWSRFIPENYLQTGAKNYGLHLAPQLSLCLEDDPRVTLVPNFYYDQEDVLKALSAQSTFSYTILRPSHIIGAVKGNFMNVGIALGIYFAVQKELKEPAIYPGSETKYYNCVETFSSATLNSYMMEWCALTPECADEAFNCTNGDIPIWARTFPELASYFGVVVLEDQFRKSAPKPASVALTAQSSPSDRVGAVELRNCLSAWSKEPRVREAWRRLAQREGLDEEVFEQASWGFADGVMGLGDQVVLGMTKVCELHSSGRPISSG